MPPVQPELTTLEVGIAQGRSLGARIRAARLAKGLGVRELARLADCSASLVSQIERGRANPSVSTLYALGDALGISVASLFETPSGSDDADASSLDLQGALSLAHSTLGAEHWPATRGPKTLEETILLRRAERRVINLEKGVHWELLLPRPELDVDFLEVFYAPRGGSTVDEHAIRHYGREMAVIIEGALSARIGFEQYELAPGDSLSFASTVPHQYWNPGDTPTRAVFVVLGGWSDR
jgi:transcriptional regulator with XRE-family HTH domain